MHGQPHIRFRIILFYCIVKMYATRGCKWAASKSAKEYARYLARTVLGKVRSDELNFVGYAVLSCTVVNYVYSARLLLCLMPGGGA